jgi:hypothetical protein
LQEEEEKGVEGVPLVIMMDSDVEPSARAMHPFDEEEDRKEV